MGLASSEIEDLLGEDAGVDCSLFPDLFLSKCRRPADLVIPPGWAGYYRPSLGGRLLKG
jgi:hypothetical protein